MNYLKYLSFIYSFVELMVSELLDQDFVFNLDFPQMPANKNCKPQ